MQVVSLIQLDCQYLISDRDVEIHPGPHVQNLSLCLIAPYTRGYPAQAVAIVRIRILVSYCRKYKFMTYLYILLNVHDKLSFASASKESLPRSAKTN
jgi:hypothetical protein